MNMKFNPSPDGELPKSEPSRTQGPEDTGRRNFLKGILGLAGAGAAVAAGMKGIEVLSEDPTKENRTELLQNLLEEMKERGLSSVPLTETTANDGLLSSAGWVRLEKIIEQYEIPRGGGDRSITSSELEQMLLKEKKDQEREEFLQKGSKGLWRNTSTKG